MANDSQDLEVGGEKKGKGMLFIIIGVVLLAGGAGAFFMFSGGDDKKEAVTAGDEQASSAPKEPAIYIGIPNAITSPVKAGKRNRMVQIKMSLMVRGREAEGHVKKHIPRLKNDLLSLISKQEAETIIRPEGRKKLQEETLALVQESMTELAGKPYIEKVLFVSFVLQ